MQVSAKTEDLIMYVSNHCSITPIHISQLPLPAASSGTSITATVID